MAVGAEPAPEVGDPVEGGAADQHPRAYRLERFEGKLQRLHRRQIGGRQSDDVRGPDSDCIQDLIMWGATTQPLRDPALVFARCSSATPIHPRYRARQFRLGGLKKVGEDRHPTARSASASDARTSARALSRNGLTGSRMRALPGRREDLALI